MKKIGLIIVVFTVLATILLSSTVIAKDKAKPVTVESGLCASLSKYYGPTFVDVNAGSIKVGGQTYNVAAALGVTAGANSKMNFYAYMRGVKSYIGTAIAGSTEDSHSFLPDRVLIATVTSGPNPNDPALNYGGVILNIKSYIPGCKSKRVKTSRIKIGQERLEMAATWAGGSIWEMRELSNGEGVTWNIKESDGESVTIAIKNHLATLEEIIFFSQLSKLEGPATITGSLGTFNYTWGSKFPIRPEEEILMHISRISHESPRNFLNHLIVIRWLGARG